MNVQPLFARITKDLQEHDFLTVCLITNWENRVSKQEFYDSLINPLTSHYYLYSYKFEYKPVLQEYCFLENILFYAVYCGYLYYSIREDERYDNNVWTYKYMHEKLDEQIFEPIFYSLMPQMFGPNKELAEDKKLDEFLKQLYIPESCKVFSIVYKCIFGYIKQSNLDNIKIYDDNVDKNTPFYKEELPRALEMMHRLGVYIFLECLDGPRLKGKNLMSTNLWGNLNDLNSI